MKRLPTGGWVDDESGEVIVAELPRRLQSIVDAALVAGTVLGREAQLARITASPRSMYANRALRRRAEEKLSALQVEHAALVARIEHGWGWLDRHPDGERFEERETHVIAWVGQYESVYRAISAARAVLS